MARVDTTAVAKVSARSSTKATTSRRTGLTSTKTGVPFTQLRKRVRLSSVLSLVSVGIAEGRVTAAASALVLRTRERSTPIVRRLSLAQTWRRTVLRSWRSPFLRFRGSRRRFLCCLRKLPRPLDSLTHPLVGLILRPPPMLQTCPWLKLCMDLLTEGGRRIPKNDFSPRLEVFPIASSVSMLS